MANYKNGKKKKAAAVTAIATAVAVMAGTFMWFETTDKVDNQMELDLQDVGIVEEYDPDGDVVPGAEIEKGVKVYNNGEAHVAVRVRFEESLELLDINSKKEFVVYTNSSPFQTGVDSEGNPVYLKGVDFGVAHTGKTPLPVKVAQEVINTVTSGKYSYKDITSTVTVADAGIKVYEQRYTVDGIETVNVIAFNPTTRQSAGLNAAGTAYEYEYYLRAEVASGIHKEGDKATHVGAVHDNVTLIWGTNVEFDGATGTNVETPKYWVYDQNDNGWFYYNTAIEKAANAPNNVSSQLLKSVKYADDIDDEWQGAKYTLSVVMEAVQYTEDAIKDKFGSGLADSTNRLTIGVKIQDECDGTSITVQ